MPYTIGLDYGTNSVRCLIVDVTNGNELGTAVYEYETGEAGIILDPADHNLARQNPADYLKGIEVTVKAAITEAKNAVKGFEPDQIIGIGIDDAVHVLHAVRRRGSDTLPDVLRHTGRALLLTSLTTGSLSRSKRFISQGANGTTWCIGKMPAVFFPA